MASCNVRFFSVRVRFRVALLIGPCAGGGYQGGNEVYPSESINGDASLSHV